MGTKICIKNLHIFYGEKCILQDVTFDIEEQQVVALIGPSGCGKSTLLRCINRMNDDIHSFRLQQGHVLVDGQDIYKENVYVESLRTKIGMVFQRANPFPRSIYSNVAYGPKLHGLARCKKELDDIIEKSLVRSGLWDEVKDRLYTSAMRLSGGQQQRLCIARAIAINPEVILMDEPCSALDPIAAAKIEELIYELKEKFTIVIVTHSMQQAARISQKTAFLYKGRLVEYDRTDVMFTNPQKEETLHYVTGRFG